MCGWKSFPGFKLLDFPKNPLANQVVVEQRFFPTPKACFLGLNVMKYDEPNVDLSDFFCMFI